jgi:nicotinate-nucleotide adenylyltransferase
MQKIAAEHRVTNDPLFLESGALLHSLVGAEVAREKYGIKDSDILEAIAYHNTGFPGMSSLAMCVCLADFIEPNRDPFPGLEETRAMAEHSLEKALLMSLEATIRHVCSKGKKLHPRTMNTAAWLKTLPAVKKNKKRKD